MGSSAVPYLSRWRERSASSMPGEGGTAVRLSASSGTSCQAAPSTLTPGPSPASGRGEARTATIGVALACAIIAAWATIHVTGVFSWRWTLATALLAVPVVLLQTWLSVGLFIVSHDAIHGSLAPGRPRVNRGPSEDDEGGEGQTDEAGARTLPLRGRCRRSRRRGVAARDALR